MLRQSLSCILLSCAILVAFSNLRQVASSIADVTEDDGAEARITVVSSKPETTYDGKIGYNARGWGFQSILKMQYKAGEVFCFYTPVLGMRNLTGFFMLQKFWDADIELTLHNSEGQELGRSNITVTGQRSPYGLLKYENIPRPDIVQICVLNHGSAKTILHSVHLSRVDEFMKAVNAFDNMTAAQNVTLEALIRLENRVAEISGLTKYEISTILRDYQRQMAIGTLIDRRCIICSILVLFCGLSSTAVIRRWFGSPRSSV